VATADEKGEVMLWSLYNFSYVASLKIPDTYDKNECFEFVHNDPHEGFEGETKIIEIKFLREKDKEFYLLVLESRGCIHILNTKDIKVFQVHVVNIGQYAHFDLDYEQIGTRLYSFDADLKIRIHYKVEDADLASLKSEGIDDITLQRFESQNPTMATTMRKVSFAKHNSVNYSDQKNPAPPSSPNKERSLSILRKGSKHQTVAPTAPIQTRKRNKALVGKNDPAMNVKISAGSGWAFYLVKVIRHPVEKIPVKIPFIQSK